MYLPVNPTKVLRLFAPLWLLLALSLLLHWQRWQESPLILAFVGALPVAAALIAGLMRDRWRLELTATALVHRTLGFTETFEWRHMGPLHVKPAPILSIFLQTLWFAYPIDAPQTLQQRGARLLGRRLLLVFGDHSAAETIKMIEDWRTLHTASR